MRWLGAALLCLVSALAFNYIRLGVQEVVETTVGAQSAHELEQAAAVFRARRLLDTCAKNVSRAVDADIHLAANYIFMYPTTDLSRVARALLYATFTPGEIAPWRTRMRRKSPPSLALERAFDVLDVTWPPVCKDGSGIDRGELAAAIALGLARVSTPEEFDTFVELCLSVKSKVDIPRLLAYAHATFDPTVFPGLCDACVEAAPCRAAKLCQLPDEVEGPAAKCAYIRMTRDLDLLSNLSDECTLWRLKTAVIKLGLTWALAMISMCTSSAFAVYAIAMAFRGDPARESDYSTINQLFFNRYKGGFVCDRFHRYALLARATAASTSSRSRLTPRVFASTACVSTPYARIAPVTSRRAMSPPR